jgi:PhnB protein
LLFANAITSLKFQKKVKMASLSTYLNFQDKTEAAFNYYKEVFQTEFNEPIQRFKDLPLGPEQKPLPETVQELVLHVSLKILGGHILMGSDAPGQFGFNIQHGNSQYICLSPDSKEETDRLFEALSKDGKVTQPMQTMFWGAYYGTCTDKFGVQWMFNYNPKAAGA